MSLLKRAAAVAVVGVLAGNVSRAAAQDPPEDPDLTPTPTATPTPTPDPTVIPTPDSPLVPPFDGTTIYVTTVTTTTTNVDGPITWVAAPITTSVSNSGATVPGAAGPIGGVPVAGGANSNLELNLRGCGSGSAKGTARPVARKKVVSQAQIRVPRTATLLLRVNGRRIATVALDGTGSSPGVPLRVQLGRDGSLSVRRPSRQVLRVQACTPRAATTRKELK